MSNDPRYDAARMTDQSFAKAFARISVAPETSCWLYNGHKSRGYPTIARRENGRLRYYLAHRYFYQKLVAAIPDGRVVLHSCDTPNCCNPDHLRVGTQSENMRDMHRKGRARAAGGSAAVPAEVKRAVLKLIEHGALQSALAEAIGCSQAAITSWKIKGVEHAWR